MERERKFKIVALVAVIIAVIGLSIAFAAMSRTLNINGRGNVDPSNWDIYFTNLSQPTLKGEASVSGTPTLATKGVTISNMNVTLKKPNDSVVYTVDIKNDGDIDAEIENLVLPTFTSAQQELFDFTVVYTSNNTPVSIGDTLAKGETKNVTITFKYKDITDESLLPSTAQQISLSYQIIYKQTNKEVLVSGSGGQNSGPNSGSQYGAEIISKEIAPGIFATYYGGTPMAKSETGIVQMSNDNRVADDVRYEGGSLVITGTGAMPDLEGPNFELLTFLAGVNTEEELMGTYNEQTDQLTFKYNPTSLVVDEGITKIGNYSFVMVHTITSANISNTVTALGDYSFQQTSLTSITVPSSVRTIGRSVFDSTNLASITLNEGLETIEYNAFIGFKGTTIRIPSTVTSIGGRILEDASSLSEVYIAGNSFTLNGGPFADIPNSITIYCRTQNAYDILSNNLQQYSRHQAVLDPTKFN